MTENLKNTKVKDCSSKTVFKDPVLCAQFLRSYVDIPLLKEVEPKDIEDVTTRFVHMFTEERDADTVKRIHTKLNDTPFFLVSLIEHKSKVDYNVVMQILRYMVFIWEGYEKERNEQHKGISKTKEFKYPPILPIIFYDGVDNWTAATKLHERILFSDMFLKYIPDYQCILVQLKDYSNAEVMKKKEALSIIMLIDKIQDFIGYARFREEINEKYLEEVLDNTPEYLLEIVVQVIEGILTKLNVPNEEVERFTEQIKERKMGALLANFKGWDVQALRREAQKMRDKGLAEGRREGIEQGIERISQLTLLLIGQNRLADLERSAKDAAYREQLFQEFGL